MDSPEHIGVSIEKDHLSRTIMRHLETVSPMNRFLIPVLLVSATLLAGCTDNGSDSNDVQPPPPSLSGDITMTGSSTVYPVGQAWGEEFQAAHRDVRVSYNSVGTGAGFKVFCRGEAPVTGASRPIKSSETADCGNNSVAPFEIQVAFDALSAVVSTKNTFAQDITVQELNRIWTANASKQVNRWNELRPEWPNEKIVLYGPGTDSGTFDYWVETIIHPFDGTATKGRSDYTPSEDDNALVNGVAASPYALAYFGVAYVQENSDKVRSVSVDAGKGGGPIAPTEANVHAGTYTPLARPIFFYTDGKPTGVIKAFFDFGMSETGQDLVTEVGYITMPPALLATVKAKMAG